MNGLLKDFSQSAPSPGGSALLTSPFWQSPTVTRPYSSPWPSSRCEQWKALSPLSPLAHSPASGACLYFHHCHHLLPGKASLSEATKYSSWVRHKGGGGGLSKTGRNFYILSDFVSCALRLGMSTLVWNPTSWSGLESLTSRFQHIFSCPGSSIPDLGESVTGSVPL